MRTMSGSPCLHYDCSNRNSFGYCKTTVCINEHYQQEQWGLPSTTNKTESVVIKQQTNADRIRAMSDEELAGFISVMSSCNGCKAKASKTAHPCLGLYEGCKGNWLDWLKQEVEDE